MADTTIEWTDTTWNPIRGCIEVTPGCARCYAKTFAERFRGVAGHPYEQGFDPRIVPAKLGEPLTWREPRMVFVNSMSDPFQFGRRLRNGASSPGLPWSYVAAMFGVMALCGHHTFQVLTKGAQEMLAFCNAMTADGCLAASAVPEVVMPRGHGAMVRRAMEAQGRDPDAMSWPPSNVWLGVSVENRKHGLPRVRELRAVRGAAVRWLSMEPLLEDLGDVDLTGIDWVVVGGESGPLARRCDHAWLRRVVAQCDEQSVPVFVKQLGARQIVDGGVVPASRLNRKGGRLDAMPVDLQRREWPRVAVRP